MRRAPDRSRPEAGGEMGGARAIIGADVAATALASTEVGGARKIVKATAMAKRLAPISPEDAEVMLCLALREALEEVVRLKGPPSDPESREDFTITLAEKVDQLLAGALMLLMVRVDEVQEAE